jgi:hypothetical protein
MARTLQFTGLMTWPLEDGQQAAKANLSMSLPYTSMLSTEKVYSAPVVDEAVTLPMASAKFLLMRAKTADVSVKINGSASAISLKAGAAFIVIQNDDGAVTALTVTVATAPATLEFYAFA